MENRQISMFFDRLDHMISDKSLVKLVLSNRRNPASDLKNLIISPVNLRSGEMLKFVYRHESKDITKNHSPAEALPLIRSALENDFLNADLFTAGGTWRLFVSQVGKVKLREDRKAAIPKAPASHDREKQRIIATENNIWLRELGVLNASFELRHEMKDKYLQIDRYIGLLRPFIAELDPPAGFRIADMGSGKGYLTFALYDYMANTLGREPVMTGIEARKDLTELSNRVAEKAGFGGLKFVRGSILDADPGKIDMLIALHACDTATDDAIFRGITAGAKLIVCAPCCHKQVRKDMEPGNDLKAITGHGILRERLAEILTDAIRALVLEARGYKSSVFEFISAEHTAKNLMIVGIRRKGRRGDKEKAMEKIHALRGMFGIGRHYLEELCPLPALPLQGEVG
jgi:hypothetical protein